MGRGEVKENPIIDVIKKWSTKTPDSIVLESCDGKSISFKGLLEVSKKFDNYFKHLINDNSRIAIALPVGFDGALLTLLATSKHTVVPLNPGCSVDEFEDYFLRFSIDVLIVLNTMEKAVVETAKNNGIFVLGYKGYDEGNVEFEILNKENQVLKRENKKNNEDIVFVIPTSGTTAQPKIVSLSFSHVYFSALNICKYLKLDNKDSCLSPMPLYHVHGLMVLVSSVFAGSKVICAPGYNSDHFLDCLKGFSPTWYTASAGIQENILLKARNNKFIFGKTSLRFIRSSSAPLSPETTKGLEEIFKAPIAESYGMTEATLQICSQPLPPEKRKYGSCGKATDIELKIVDEKGNDLNADKVGEILIRGKSVITKYENNEEENKKSFTNGWFKTGDLGSLDEDGFLFIKGRIKEMINKGGEKISPREIEEILMCHENVEQAVAFSMPHKTLGEDLAVAIVVKDYVNISEEDLRKYLYSKVSQYKIPSKFYFVKEVPRTSVGKPIRVNLYEKLKEQENPAVDNDNKYYTFQFLFEKILNTKLSVDDNFFENGLDSMRTQEVVNEFFKLGIKITFFDIQNHPSIKSLFKYLSEKDYE